ncbi:hypothetical protein NQ315_003916 [Exocentrus adspersus]|uniref:Uncharacterized protein n=1 Tax=Exocentrus adspersus TaxID=1586481 RepID=A0AAV8VZ74_9CUCU|nr:hypothetical protein NQ315_003916 [Exocentrus adspersus]
MEMNSYVCKILVFEAKDQRALKSRKIDDKENQNRFVRANSIKKCLFGVANPEDTKQMLEEQHEIDRKRFSERFGFDIAEIERMESEANDENVNHGYGNQQVGGSRKCAGRRRVLKGKRRVFKQHNSQAVITG